MKSFRSLSGFWPVGAIGPAALALAGLSACGGGGSPAPAPAFATKLEYTDPADTAGYRLVKNTASSANGKLVLELRGPASGTGRGVSFSVETDSAKAAFAKVSPGDPEMAQYATFDLGSTEPKLFKGVLDGDNTLRVSIAQKGAMTPAQSLSGPLARFALELKPNLPQNTTINLMASGSRVLPASGPSETITIAVGRLVAQ